MGRHTYPFACTTNAPDLLDPATARRFLFKVRFLPMTAGHIGTALRRVFGMDCPEFVWNLEGLTPGDSNLICRKAEVFGACGAVRLGRWLEDEVAAKPEGRGELGFESKEERHGPNHQKWNWVFQKLLSRTNNLQRTVKSIESIYPYTAENVGCVPNAQTQSASTSS
jgi:hypothetical protein